MITVKFLSTSILHIYTEYVVHVYFLRTNYKNLINITRNPYRMHTVFIIASICEIFTLSFASSMFFASGTTPFNAKVYSNTARNDLFTKKMHEVTWLSNMNNITKRQIERLEKEIRIHGVLKIPGQRLSRQQQLDFSKELGDIVVLPDGFRGIGFNS